MDLHHFIEANPDLDVLNQMLSQVSMLKAKKLLTALVTPSSQVHASVAI